MAKKYVKIFENGSDDLYLRATALYDAENDTNIDNVSVLGKFTETDEKVYFNNDPIITSSDLATVATSGSYNDLSDKPTIPTVPSLAKVATSGSYNDLSEKPTIPTSLPASNVTDTYSSTGTAPVSGKAVASAISGKADKASITAGTVGTSSATSGSSLAVPYVTVNAQGIVTGYGTHTHTVSGFSTTDTKVTSAGSTLTTITASTSDITANTTTLATGQLYVVYE